MSDEIKGKKPRIKLPKTIIIGLIMSSVVWIPIFVLIAKENSEFNEIVISGGLAVICCIVAVISGAIGYAVVTWFYNRFTWFTRYPVYHLLCRYIFHPLLGIIGFPMIVLILVSCIIAGYAQSIRG